MFTELAERKGVILIVSGKCVYVFTKYNDLQKFQDDMTDGAYIYDIINKMVKNSTKGETSAY
jgi:hypothetical protein